MIMFKVIRVVAAVICNSLENKETVFATARGYGEFKGKWEFPGGKIKSDETTEQALVREIREELNVLINVGDFITTIEYDYPNFHLSMDCYWCEIISGNLTLVEALNAKWLTKEELYTVDWIPADVELLELIEQEMINNKED